MAKKSAGLLVYRFYNSEMQVLLVHPGGPFWAKKDLGAWSIPKGEFGDDEDALHAAIREVEEELGFLVSGEFVALSPVKQKSGKLIFAWALQKDLDAQNIKSNTFELEWPPTSGTQIIVPEVDRAGWFNVEEAKKKINMGQVALIDELVKLVGIA
ncbi:NUDIX domain-containing protein [soil metagenome]